MTHFRLAAICLIMTAITVLPAHNAVAVKGDITLIKHFPIQNYFAISDVWGYSDTASGKEYALVGEIYMPLLYIIDVTDPFNPQIKKWVSTFPSFDIKSWGNYAYGCDGDGTGTDSKILDISDPLNPVIQPTAYRSAHNIAISSDGLMFTSVNGLSILDLAANPTNPPQLWTNSGGGHDANIKGNRVYDFRGSLFTKVWDVTNPSSPTLLATIDDPTIIYHHHGDVTTDGNYLYICDELALYPTPDISVWDISNLASPTRVANISDSMSTVHNMYIIDDIAFVAHYSAGFKVFNVSNPAAPVLVDTYDTSVFSGEGYEGAFGVFPFTSNGLVYVSDIDGGLFIFSVEGYFGSPPTSAPRPHTPAGVRLVLGQNYPNPFNPSTRVEYEIPGGGRANLTIFDVQGRHIRTLVNGTVTPGLHTAIWNGVDDSGSRVGSGVYYYRLESGPTTTTKRMVLLK